MKKKFYLVQIGVSHSSPCFLPYAAGCIAAYLKRDNEINAFYEIADIVVMREKIREITKRFVNPSIVAFSCYAWNFEFNKTLAQELRRLFPEVVIIFGGHSVAKGGGQLDEFPYVDYLMHNEGEESTALLLKALESGGDLSKVPNLSFRNDRKNITTADYNPADLSDYPSPYLDGIFDSIMAEFPNVEFHATLETNRGCPYQCAYCEWCFTDRLRTFPMEKIKKEIEWIARHKIKYCYCADANFGILDRDIEIAEYVIKQKKIYGYPDVFKPCYAKESNDNVFKAGYILNKNKADKSVTLAYQSLDPDALANIGRRNLTLEKFADLDARYTAAGIPTYTELILGLPGETYDSFCKGICRLLESGQNNSMTVYDCQVYPNSEMGSREYQQRFGIKTSKIPLLGIHYNPEFNGINEYLEIITETATMPKSDWVRSCMFSTILQTFHHLGLLRFFAIYLHNEKNISYYDFYNRLFDFVYGESKGYIHDLFVELSRRKNDTETADWTYQREIFGATGWYFEEGAFLELVYHSDDFWEEILAFLRKFDIEKPVFDSLLDYQKSLVRVLNKDEITVRSDYNFYPYFESRGGTVKLKRIKSTLHVKSDKSFDNWADYAREVIWFGKRYSATLLVNPREHITYTEERL